MTGRSRTLLVAFLAIIVVAYIGSYVVLSRRGFAEARSVDSEGFYYLTPANSDPWRRQNGTLRVLFFPINFLDQCLGTGMAPSSDPLFDLSSLSGVLQPIWGGATVQMWVER